KVASQSGFFDLRVLVGSVISLANASWVLVALGTFPETSLLAQSAEQNARVPAIYQTRVGEHHSRAQSTLSGAKEGAIYSQGLDEVPPIAAMAPTRSSFMATWDSISGATGYRLDVS